MMKAAGEDAWKKKMGGAVKYSEREKDTVKKILTEPGSSLSEMMVHLDGFGRDVMGSLGMSQDKSSEVEEVFKVVDEALPSMVRRLDELLREDLGEERYEEFARQGGVRAALQDLDVDFVLKARDAYRAKWRDTERIPDEEKRKKAKEGLRKDIAGRSDDITMGAFKKGMDWKTGTGGWDWDKRQGVGGKDFDGCKKRVLDVDFKDEGLLRDVAARMGIRDAATRDRREVGQELVSMWTNPSGPPPWYFGEKTPSYHTRKVSKEELAGDPVFGKHSREHFIKEMRRLAQPAIDLLVGPMANRLDPEHAWVQYVRALNMPLRSGISGTTNRLLNTGKALGMTPVEVRLPVLGHLLKVEAHSYHEIMSAAATHGAPYTPGDYKNLAPLKWEGELQRLWEEAEKKVASGGKVQGKFV